MSQQSYNVLSQAIATLQHDKIILQRQLTDTQVENQVLRRQLYHVSTLLDIAIGKLASMGISLNAPIDIRALREEVVKQANADAARGAMNSGEISDKMGETQQHFSKKRFQLRTQLLEHTKCVQCCAFGGGDDSVIVTGGLDCRLILHNFFTAEKQWDVTAHSENISDVTWFEATKNILSASYDATVKLWDPRKSEASPLYQHNSTSFVLSVAPLDKSFVFVCADAKRCTSIVDVRTHKPFSWEHATRVNSLAYDSSTGLLVMGHSNGSIDVWDMRKVGSVFSLNSTGVSQEELLGTGSSTTTTLNPDGAGQLGALVSPMVGAHRVSALCQSNLSGCQTPQSGRLPEGCGQFSSSERDVSTTLSSLHMTRPLETWFNDQPGSSISFLACHNSSDDTKRLICVSNDNMVRVYRGNLNSGRRGGLYHLRNLLPNIPSRGFGVRCGFWKGNHGKSQLPTFLDDGERDIEIPVARRVTECDLLVTGGPDNKATVFDITDEASSSTVVEYLEEHRDRVTGAVVHHSDNRPIIATTSADSIVRIWVPTKT